MIPQTVFKSVGTHHLGLKILAFSLSVLESSTLFFVWWRQPKCMLTASINFRLLAGVCRPDDDGTARRRIFGLRPGRGRHHGVERDNKTVPEASKVHTYNLSSFLCWPLCVRSVTRWPDGLFDFGHLRQRKLLNSIKKLPKDVQNLAIYYENA